MRIRELRLIKFMAHEDTGLAFPPSGLVVVTGENGQGKSSLVEAVAMALWGKTLRGTPPWAEDTGLVRCIADGIEATRTKGKTIKVDWAVRDDGSHFGNALDSLVRLGGTDPVDDDTRPAAYESTTHAQKALEKLIGPFDIWRRSSAFSSSDAAHFSLATDGERKRLLETILGLDTFDPALERCRADLKLAETTAADKAASEWRARAALDAALLRMQNAEKAVASATAALPELLPMPPMDVANHATDVIMRSGNDIRQVRARLRETDDAAAVAASELRKAKAAAAEAAQSKTCPTCRRPLPEGPHKHVGVDLEALAKASSEAQSVAARARAAAEEEVAEIEAGVAILREGVSKANAARAAAEERAKARAAAEKTRDGAASERDAARAVLVAAEEALGVAEEAAMKADNQKATLTAVEAVLGLKGVRAHVLGASLSGLEAVANAWLPRLGLPALGLKLRPYAERKTGGVTDAIGVEVSGAGNGHGYKATSNGERRRVDLALLLGLAEIAAASSGRENGTLFFDELFDALDAPGVKAVSSALVDLARDRCVVVVTHNPALVQGLPADQSWRIAGGKVTVEG
jgi:DNA repair exonuclease SbcCD ATPase subunit